MKRYYPGMISDDDPEDIEIAYVLHTDHLAAVEEARRAAYSDAVNEINKEFSAGPIDWRLGTADNVSKVELAFYERLSEIRDWLEARAEGRGE